MSLRLDHKKLDLGAAPKLNLLSIRDLEYRLGLDRDCLRALAAKARGHYDPFIKPEKHRPFQKVFKKPKKRVIDNPDEELKDIQKRIYRRLLRHEILPVYICGGVKKRSLLDNIYLHLGAKKLVTVDIANFFPSVTNEHVYFIWDRVLNCSPEIARLLTQLTTFNGHLPQGAATSTPLANILICVIDKRIREQCARGGVKYSTWVDDLAFSGPNATALIPIVVTSLSRVGLRISRRKIKIMGPGSRQILNGIVLGRHPGVLRESLSRIRSGIHKLASGAVPLEEQKTYVRSLVARIRQAEMINARQVQKLRLGLIEALRGAKVLKTVRQRYCAQLVKPVASGKNQN